MMKDLLTNKGTNKGLLSLALPLFLLLPSTDLLAQTPSSDVPPAASQPSPSSEHNAFKGEIENHFNSQIKAQQQLAAILIQGAERGQLNPKSFPSNNEIIHAVNLFKTLISTQGKQSLELEYDEWIGPTLVTKKAKVELDIPPQLNIQVIQGVATSLINSIVGPRVNEIADEQAGLYLEMIFQTILPKVSREIRNRHLTMAIPQELTSQIVKYRDEKLVWIKGEITKLINNHANLAWALYLVASVYHQQAMGDRTPPAGFSLQHQKPDVASKSDGPFDKFSTVIYDGPPNDQKLSYKTYFENLEYLTENNREFVKAFVAVVLSESRFKPEKPRDARSVDRRYFLNFNFADSFQRLVALLPTDINNSSSFRKIGIDITNLLFKYAEYCRARTPEAFLYPFPEHIWLAIFEYHPELKYLEEYIRPFDENGKMLLGSPQK